LFLVGWGEFGKSIVDGRPVMLVVIPLPLSLKPGRYHDFLLLPANEHRFSGLQPVNNPLFEFAIMSRSSTKSLVARIKDAC